MKRIIWLLILILFIGGVSLALAGSRAPAEQPTEPSGVYFGIFREGAPKNMQFISQFENKYGTRVSMVMWYQDYSSPFPAAEAANVWQSGAVPHIVWEPWIWGNEDKIKLADIINGKWDSYIESWAEGAKNFGNPVFVRWGHEFNIGDYPWAIAKNGKDPNRYAEAWRHVHSIFRKVGAKNVKWIWCPMRESWPQEIWNDWELCYPGDNYVDWIGIDGYNWGKTQAWSRWQTFTELFRESARNLWRKHPTKPIMIAEFACAEKGGDKSAWISSVPKELNVIPYISAILWFDVKKETSWQISSSKKSDDAFKKIMRDPIFILSQDSLVSLDTGYLKEFPKKIASALKTDSPPKIDGKLEEWGGCTSISLGRAEEVAEGILNWSGPADCSGRIYLRWDTENLYLAAEVLDDLPRKNAKTKADIWNGDAIEFTLSTNSELDPNRSNFEVGDYQVGISIGNGAEVKPSIWIWTKHREVKNYEVVCKTNANYKGYTLEAKIPWANFGKFVPQGDLKIPFDIALDDGEGKDREVQLVWNGDFLFYKDPGVWGTLHFIE